MENKETVCSSCLEKNDCPAMPNDKMYRSNSDTVIYCDKYKQIPFDLWNH